MFRVKDNSQHERRIEMTKKELLTWFKEFVEAVRVYVKSGGELVCYGNSDSTIQFASWHLEEFRQLAKALNREIVLNEHRGTEGEYIEYQFRYEEFVVICLIDNPDYKKEIKSDD